jgi:hypothetical protein
LLVYPDGIEHYLGVLDDTVLFGMSKEGRPHSVLISDHDHAQEWAQERFRECRRNATTVDEFDSE